MTNFSATSPSLETNNRKIRKIELAAAGFSGLGASSGSNFLSSEEDAFWSSDDSWLVQKTLDNVKGLLGNKPTSLKKEHGEKYPLSYWIVPPRQTSTISTTTAAPPAKLPAILSMASTELLNLDFGNPSSAYEEADHEAMLMLTTTTTPPNITEPSTTELPTSVDVASDSAETVSEDSTTDFGETTDPTTSNDSSTSDAPQSSTTEAEELNSQTTGSESTTTVASDKLSTTTLNADYAVDESFSESSGQTSIYGLDKNSLIMRLLRARSNQNVLI